MTIYLSDLTAHIGRSCNEGQSWRQIAEGTGVSEGGVQARYLASIG